MTGSKWMTTCWELNEIFEWEYIFSFLTVDIKKINCAGFCGKFVLNWWAGYGPTYFWANQFSRFIQTWQRVNFRPLISSIATFLCFEDTFKTKTIKISRGFKLFTTILNKILTKHIWMWSDLSTSMIGSLLIHISDHFPLIHISD